ncbi:MAG: hypothetical protein WC055_02135 [Melioribacteraceae bacterium]
MLIEKENNILENTYVKTIGKAVIWAFFVGAAWQRLEYKIDETTEKVIKKIDEHIISDKFEKQMLSNELSQLRSMVEDVQDQVKQINPNAFVRPDEVRIQTKRRR